MRKRSEVPTEGQYNALEAALQTLREPRDTIQAPPPVPEEPAGIRFNGQPLMSQGFERIVTKLFDLADPEAEYDALEAALKLGDQRTDHGALQKALDEAEDNARRAHKLYCNAKVEALAHEREFAVFQAPIWATVTAKLQEQKDKGSRSKQITDGDVQAGCAEHYPDEYREHAVRSAKIKLMVEHAEVLVKLWTQRCSGLQTQISNRRK